MVRINCPQCHEEYFDVPDDRPGEYIFICTNWYYKTGLFGRDKDYSIKVKITVNRDGSIKSRVG